MKVFYSFVLLILVGMPCAVQAGMELNGTVATENYLGLREGGFYNFRNANWFGLKVRGNPSEHVAAMAEFELRNTNFTRVQTIDELWDRSQTDPVSWRVRDAYVDIYGFLLDGGLFVLDIRAGKQHIAWGTGDGFNPSNPFDPFDLENPLAFDQRMGNVALKATLYVGDEWFNIEGVVAPRFLPSMLPVDLFLGDDPLANPLMPRFDLAAMLPQGMEGFQILVLPPGYDVLRTVTPAAEVGNVQAGARLRFSLLDLDCSLSYAHARQSMPVPTKVQATAGVPGCPEGQANCLAVQMDDVELIYPRVDVIGLNLRGDLAGIGVWAEVALMLPEQINTEILTEVPLLGETAMELEAISDEPFTKWVLGAEYTFPGGFYTNLQWVHGLFVEMTGHRLHDYLFLVLRQSLLSDRLNFELSLGGELDTTLGRSALAGLGQIMLTYKPFDGSQVSLGYVLARGEAETSLEMFEALDQAFFRVRADF